MGFFSEFSLGREKYIFEDCGRRYPERGVYPSEADRPISGTASVVSPVRISILFLGFSRSEAETDRRESEG